MTEHQSKTLIKIVQVNPLLWKKSDKKYHDSRAKEAAWKSAGQLLDPPMTGEAAATRFKSLRDTFNRQNKQEQLYLALHPGSPFISSSIYYESLRFLEPEIKRRRSTSNFTGESSNGGKAKKRVGGCQLNGENWIESEIQVPTSLKILKLDEGINSLTSETKEEEAEKKDPIVVIEVSSTLEDHVIKNNSLSTTAMTLDGSQDSSKYKKPLSMKSDEKATLENETDTTGQLWDEIELMGEPESLLKRKLPDLFEEDLLPSFNLPVMNSKPAIPKVKVPPLDEFARKRNSDQCQVVDALTMVAQNTSEMFKHLIDKKDGATEQKKTPDDIAINPKLVILKFALDLVPEEHQAVWVTEVLQSAQNYPKK